MEAQSPSPMAWQRRFNSHEASTSIQIQTQASIRAPSCSTLRFRILNCLDWSQLNYDSLLTNYFGERQCWLDTLQASATSVSS